MTFCYSPWSNIDFSPTGAISPCCKFQTEHYQEKYNIQHNNIQDYTCSEFLKHVKDEFVAGTWPAGCTRCRIEEENNIPSKRQLDFERWQHQYQSYSLENSNFITSSIAFGNTCNLKCITCSPYASSKWSSEYRSIYGVTIEHNKFYKENFVDDFVAVAPNLIHVDIPGGEPFLSGVPEQKKLLNYYIESGAAHNITLHYTTNATVFPDAKWWDLWQHFREIDMQLSIDGVGKRYEYIRYPANWAEVNQNIDQYLAKQSNTNFKISVSHTVSSYNVYYLDEFFTWCYNKQLPTPWLGRVHTPAHMRPSVWPEVIKNKIIDKLNQSQWEQVKIWAGLLSNTNDEEHFETFWQLLQKHDDYRRLKFSDTFPELYDLCKLN
jgi:hypothetical protein